MYIDGSLWGDCVGKYDPIARKCGDGSATALASMESATQSAKPGMVFVIRGGDYKEVLHLTVSGTAANPIIYKARAGEKVTIRDIDSIDAGEEYGPIWLDNVNYNTVSGIRVTESVGFLRAINSHHNTIRDNNFDTSYLYPSLSKRGGLYFGFSNHNRIFNNTIRRGTDSMSLVHSDHNVVQGNHFEESGHELLTMKCSTGNVVRGNHFRNPQQKMMAVFDCEAATSAWIGNGSFAQNKDILDRSHRNLIEQNVFAEAVPYYSTSGGNGIQYAGQQGIIRHNVFYSANVGLGMTRYEPEAQYNRGNRVYHNVFHDNQCGGIALFGAKSNNDKGITDNKYANNILWDNKGWAPEGNCQGVSAGQVVYRDSFIGHLFIGNALGSPLGSEVLHNEFGEAEEINGYASKGQFKNTVIGDPGFVDTAKRNYALRPDSPVIDRGVTLAHITSADGSGTQLQLDDASWFFDGNGISGEEADWIQIEGQPIPAQITTVDLATNTIHLTMPVSWKKGDGLSLPWHGAAPDPGARESLPVR
jgi:parallel beta-helix repeat protein